jgi:putative SOS response-associated peptidase YedK
MPVIVAPEDYAKWLGEDEADPVRLLQMLKPFPAEAAMKAFPVDVRVGNVNNDDAALIESPNVALIS